MAPMPALLRVGRMRYRVTQDSEEWNRLSTEGGMKGGDHGGTNHHMCLVAINPSDAPYQKADTLLHEVLHIIWYISAITGADLEHTDDKDEYMVSHLTPWLAMVIADNPGLLAYVQNPEG